MELQEGRIQAYQAADFGAVFNQKVFQVYEIMKSKSDIFVKLGRTLLNSKQEESKLTRLLKLGQSSTRSLIVGLVILSLLYYLFNLFRGQPSSVIGDSDLICMASSLILSRDSQDAIGINVKADTDLRNTPWIWLNSRHLKSSTTSNGLIRVNAPTKLLSMEEILQKLLHSGNSTRTTYKNDFMNAALIHLGILQTTLNKPEAAPKQIHVDLLKSGTGKDCVEINAFK
ncbi:hypothetical protein RJ639_037408 [Escallonia herrerae]|uniref:Uncharacterized protein n=1 Tax=Escallonia herrerae TaxID=1293975 RepID=A0AA89B7V0_9ASTE|nr:hypothetical protein RJ639_037408 [Escallonia herrerae]